MFIDAAGNACPCDFTMMSFGSILQRPVAELWAEMNARFQRPICVCYADECAPAMAELGRSSWPATPEETRRVLEKCPPGRDGRLPVFYQKMGLGR